MCERNIDWLPLAHSPTGTRTRPTIQACALTGNQTGSLSLCGMMPNQFCHIGQGRKVTLKIICVDQILIREVLKDKIFI